MPRTAFHANDGVAIASEPSGETSVATPGAESVASKATTALFVVDQGPYP